MTKLVFERIVPCMVKAVLILPLIGVNVYAEARVTGDI